MLVALFNVVKVESVPLNSDFFRGRRVEPVHGQSSVTLGRCARRW
ncbi:hypothetical protein C8E89_11773 [Mycolicibacterium moriokaense]|uniref:Uncharacterized protein n=1 Tax=Mycolicibacterium moriokaense TaxID=39691 RepID=A0A318HNE4_9MYCO|nr:hypothetical protein C8E89_11773 [Mycolicibacterium moriokaense]